jgi:Fe-S cluster biogenesis protein NfuA/nitrite reductase/ring-hydroxylating ferredoxin subunit
VLSEPTAESADPDALVARVQELTAGLDEIEDPATRARVEQLVGTVIELYGAGLERIFAALADTGEAGHEIGRRLADDGVVASLMLIHGLYPVDLETRVREALEGVRPYMESHAGDVELLGITDGVARIRLEGSCRGCAASSATLELAIKQALDEHAPDLAGLEVDGAAPDTRADATAERMELPMIQVDPGGGGDGGSAPSWFELDGAGTPAEGALARIEVGTVALLVANVGGTLLAYVDRCTGCGASLAEGELDGSAMRCAACSRRFDLRAAGRALDGDDLQLEPVPLLEEGEGARVALRR